MKTKNKDGIASFNDVLEDMLPKTEATTSLLGKEGDTLQHVGSDNPSTRKGNN